MSSQQHTSHQARPDGMRDYVTGHAINGAPAASPCPFCAGLEVGIECRNAPGLPASFSAICPDCFAAGPTCDSALEAAERWNTRH